MRCIGTGREILAQFAVSICPDDLRIVEEGTSSFTKPGCDWLHARAGFARSGLDMCIWVLLSLLFLTPDFPTATAYNLKGVAKCFDEWRRLWRLDVTWHYQEKTAEIVSPHNPRTSPGGLRGKNRGRRSRFTCRGSPMSKNRFPAQTHTSPIGERGNHNDCQQKTETSFPRTPLGHTQGGAGKCPIADRRPTHATMAVAAGSWGPLRASTSDLSRFEPRETLVVIASCLVHTLPGAGSILAASPMK